MSHEIDQSTGQAAIFVTGKPAWHRLGTVVDRAQNSREAIRLAGLDWEVEQWPVQGVNPANTQEVSCYPGRVMNVRTDTRAPLAVVSKAYKVFQNSEAFDFMDALVGARLCMYESAGSLKGGQRVWMLAKVPREFRAAQDDIIQPYILLTNGHDGRNGLKMIATTVRVVCMNTLNLALRNGTDSLSIAHWGNLDARIMDARRKLGLLSDRFDLFTGELRALVETKLNIRQADAYFDSLLPKAETDAGREKRQRVLHHFAANFENVRNTLPGMKYTAWAAYNAASEFSDHQKRRQGKSEGQRLDRQVYDNWLGESSRFKHRAYRKALDLVNA